MPTAGNEAMHASRVLAKLWPKCLSGIVSVEWPGLKHQHLVLLKMSCLGDFVASMLTGWTSLSAPLGSRWQTLRPLCSALSVSTYAGVVIQETQVAVRSTVIA